MRRFDVAILGAGPAGSATAVVLARRGYSVALLDKEQFPREKLCGDFLNPINWPMLRELGVEGDLLSRPHKKIVTFRFTSFYGEEVEVALAKKNGAVVFGLGLRRSDLDHILLKKAESEGAVVFQGCRAKQLKRDSQAWLLQWDRAGMVEEISARMLVGADGRNSWVAHRLGMVSSKRMGGGSVGFQLHLRCSSTIGHKVEIHLFPGGYAGIVGLGGDTVNLCLAIANNRLPDHRAAESVLNSCLPQNPFLKEFLGHERVSEIRSTYPVYFSARRSYGERLLLVGDATRVNEPVTGEGIYFALKSGFFAADTIHEAFGNGDFSATRLRCYAWQCRQAFRFRRRINALVRLLIYRPTLLSVVISLFSRKPRFLESIVNAICQPGREKDGDVINSRRKLVALR